jgi:pimeloyl-ACP methyl ester carboxylesterase
VVVELIVAVWFVGPYAYVLAYTRPHPHAVCCETPLDYGAARYDEIQVQAAEGIVLAGWYVPPRETPGAAVVVLHGAGGDRRGGAWHARQLMAAGYGVVLYDQRALGESTGERVSFGWFDGPDLLAVIDDLAGRAAVDGDRIGAVGLSGGGHVALNAAHLSPDRIAALGVDGVQAQQMADFPPPNDVGERFATRLNAQILTMAEWHLGRRAPPPFVDIFAALDRPPVVLVAAGQDDFERRVGQRYAAAAGENVDLWLIEEAWHVGGPAVVPEQYAQALHELCRWYLGATARQKGEVRSALSGHKGLLNHLLGYVYTAIERARDTGKVSWLQIGFAAASIQNNRLDPRDYTLAWNALARAAREMGLDPEAEFGAAHRG